MVEQIKYLSYLLQSYNITDLKGICKKFEIKGYSNMKKQELITFIIDNLSDEEIKEFVEEHELEIINKEFHVALSIIRRATPEKLLSLKVINRELGELEVKFKGQKWETTCFLSINKENIENPERDCDCSIGSNGGFCSHFFCCWLFALKKNFFRLQEWNLTPIPTHLRYILKVDEQEKFENLFN